MKVTVLVVVRIGILEGQGGRSAFNVVCWRGVMVCEGIIGCDLRVDKSVMKQMVRFMGQERGQRVESSPSEGRAEIGKEECSLYVVALKRGWVGLLL